MLLQDLFVYSLFIEEKKLASAVTRHLESNGTNQKGEVSNVTTHGYQEIWDFVASLVKSEERKLWVSYLTIFQVIFW